MARGSSILKMLKRGRSTRNILGILKRRRPTRNIGPKVYNVLTHPLWTALEAPVITNQAAALQEIYGPTTALASGAGAMAGDLFIRNLLRRRYLPTAYRRPVSKALLTLLGAGLGRTAGFYAGAGLGRLMPIFG